MTTKGRPFARDARLSPYHHRRHCVQRRFSPLPLTVTFFSPEKVIARTRRLYTRRGYKNAPTVFSFPLPTPAFCSVSRFFPPSAQNALCVNNSRRLHLLCHCVKPYKPPIKTARRQKIISETDFSRYSLRLCVHRLLRPPLIINTIHWRRAQLAVPFLCGPRNFFKLFRKMLPFILICIYCIVGKT